MREKQTAPRGQRGAADETQRSDPGVSGFNCTPIYAGAKWAEILVRANGKRYRAKLETIFARGFVVNRGCGAQWGMCLADWGNEAAPAQLALWGLP